MRMKLIMKQRRNKVIDGLSARVVATQETNDGLVLVKISVEGKVTKEELESLRYCIDECYDIALYAAKK